MASAVPRFRSSNVWTARSAFSAAIDGALAAIAPVSLTATFRSVKNAFPRVFVAAGPVKDRKTSTG
jgi:hypothetical protein